MNGTIFRFIERNVRREKPLHAPDACTPLRREIVPREENLWTPNRTHKNSDVSLREHPRRGLILNKGERENGPRP